MKPVDERRLLENLDDEHRDVLEVCGRVAAARGDHAYLVGGSVRDLLLQRPHDDLDIVIEGDGLAVAQAVSRALSGELTRHHAFQTATVTTPRGLRIDVATARREDYPRPGQLPRVVAGTLREDLERRDFTINTMAIALAADEWGRFIDPLGGYRDLREGRVRVMHSRSFADDPTRILRALRFALRFTYDIEPDTHAWLREAVAGGYLDDVSGDRVRKELRLTLGEAPVSGAVRLQEEEVLQGLQPGLRADEDALRLLQELIGWYGGLTAPREAHDLEAAPWTLVLACCAEALPQQARWELARRLKLSRTERAPLIEAGTPTRRAMARIGDPTRGNDAERVPDSLVESTFRGLSPGALLVVAALRGAADAGHSMIRRYLEELRWCRPALSGADLREMGVAAGPLLGEFLEKLRAARLDGDAGSAADERRLVAAWMAEDPR